MSKVKVSIVKTDPKPEYPEILEAVQKALDLIGDIRDIIKPCLLYTSPSPRDRTRSRMPSSA